MGLININPLTGLPDDGTYGTPKPADWSGGTADNSGSSSGTGGVSPTAPGALNIPGYTPDYGSLIQGDPAYAQLIKDLASQQFASITDRNSAIQRALISFGAIPDYSPTFGLSQDDWNSIATPETLALAQQNTAAGLSQESRLQKQHETNLQNIQDYLAARGGLRSGGTGIELNNEQQNFTKGEYDSRQQLLDYLSGAQRAYVETQRQNAIAKGQAASDAANRVYQTNPATPGTSATYTGKDGAGVDYYTDSGGKTYRLGPDGNPVEYAPVAGTTPAPTPTSPTAPTLTYSGDTSYGGAPKSNLAL